LAADLAALGFGEREWGFVFAMRCSVVDEPGRFVLVFLDLGPWEVNNASCGARNRRPVSSRCIALIGDLEGIKLWRRSARSAPPFARSISRHQVVSNAPQIFAGNQ